MASSVERIKREIRALDPAEVNELLRDLQHEYAMPPIDETDEASVEAAWDAEIERRVQEIQEGKVELLTAEESDRRTDAVFAKLGITRPVRQG